MPLALAVFTSLVLAACGSAGSSGSSGTNSSAGQGSASGTSGVAHARAALAANEAVPTFSDAANHPGPSFDAKKLAGKLVFNINAASTNPFWNAETAGVQEAAKAVGLRFINYQNQGTVAEWVQGMNQAIAQKAGVIILNAQNPNQLEPQIEAAHRAGIKVVEEHLFYPGQKLPGGLDGTAYAPFITAAKLEADAAIANTAGKGDVVVITSNDLLPSPPMSAAIQQEFKQYCPGCKVKTVNVDSSHWSTEIQTEVESAITADPNINYILPLYDPMSEYVVPAVVAKAKTAQVHVATYNGTPFALQYLENHNVVQVEIAENPKWIGWATMDQAMRLMMGLPVAPNEVTPLRVITSANVAQTGKPPALGEGVGSGYAQAYLKLWGVS